MDVVYQSINIKKKDIKIGKKIMDTIHNRTDGSPRTLNALVKHLLSLIKFNGNFNYKLVYDVMNALDFPPENILNETDEKRVVQI